MSQASVQTAESCSPALSSEAIYVISAPYDEAQLPGMVQRMIALFDGHRTLEGVCKDAQISVSKGLAVVKKLSAMNILSQASQRVAGRTSGTGFNAQDEDFFCSEVVLSYEEEEQWRPSAREKANQFFSDLARRVAQK